MGEMTLAHYTTADLIVPQLHARTGSAVVGELCAVLERHDRVSNCLGLYNQVMAHENLSPTIIMVPESEAGLYLKVLSALARLGQDRERMQKLLNAPDGGAMLEVLREGNFPKSVTKHE